MSKVDELPALHPYAYRPHHLLETDSKMAKLLVVTDDKNRELVLKIACMQHRSRADSNCQAIRNNVVWLPQLRHCKGLSRLLPIVQKGESRLRSWFRPRVYCGKLPQWPGNPDFVVMEYLSGGTLAQLVGNKRLTIEFSLWIAYQVAATLAQLHKQGCVHRDLKPENILFRTPPALATKLNDVMPVLIDFGIAACIGEAKLVAGSPLWMAPELQAANEQEPLSADPAWDIYALGLLCCYMLSGLRPRRRQYDYASQLEYRERVFAIIDNEAEQTTDSLHEEKNVLKQLLTRTLAQDPTQRPTAAVFAAETAQLLKTMSAPLSPTARLLMEVEQRTQLSPYSLRIASYALLSILAILLLWAAGLFRGVDLSNPTAVAAQNQRPNRPITQGLASQEQPTASLIAGATHPTATASKISTATEAQINPIDPSAARPAPNQQTGVSASRPNVDKIVAPPTLAPLPQTSTQPPPTLAPAVSFTTPLAVMTPPAGQVRLTLPADGHTSNQERVEFAWSWVGQPLAPEQCYELLFWDPKTANDKRSPIGAGRDAIKQISLRLLMNDVDPLLKTLMRNPNGFRWGVRIVLCNSPQTIVQDVQESRQYTYQDQ